MDLICPKGWGALHLFACYIDRDYFVGLEFVAGRLQREWFQGKQAFFFFFFFFLGVVEGGGGGGAKKFTFFECGVWEEVGSFVRITIRTSFC